MGDTKPHCLKCGATRAQDALRRLPSGAHVCRNEPACNRRRTETRQTQAGSGE